MSEVAGASRYMAQAMLSAKTGSTFTPNDILTESGLGSDLLTAASNLRVPGVGGLSGYARYLNQQLLNNASTVNTMFSLTGGGSATTESAQTQILALRSKANVTRLTPDLRAQIIDQAAEGTAPADGDTGSTVDTEA